MAKKERYDISGYKVPNYCKNIKFYDLTTIDGVYDFMQTMILDGVNLNDYKQIQITYQLFLKYLSIDGEDSDIAIEFLIYKMEILLFRNKFAHRAPKTPYEWYYYWNEHLSYEN